MSIYIYRYGIKMYKIYVRNSMNPKSGGTSSVAGWEITNKNIGTSNDDGTISYQWWFQGEHHWLVVWLPSILFSHILGISSSQLTFIFFRGVAQPPTRSSINGGVVRFRKSSNWMVDCPADCRMRAPRDNNGCYESCQNFVIFSLHGIEWPLDQSILEVSVNSPPGPPSKATKHGSL